MGARLLERTTRSIRPTEAGVLMHHKARSLLDQVAELTDQISERQHNVAGRVRVSAGGAYGEDVIAPAIVQFAVKHPLIAIDLVISDRRVDLVAEGFDLAIRLGALDDTTLIARRLARRRLLLCASPDYLEKAPELRSPDDLVHHACVVSPTIPWRLTTPAGTQSISPSARFASNSIATLVDAAANGLGIAWLAENHIKSHLADGRLVEVLPATRIEPSPVWMLHPSRRYLPQRVTLLMNWLIDRLGD
jgi:DNA-binding transcriptional LysR family regulator